MGGPRGRYTRHTQEFIDTVMAGWRAGETYGILAKRHEVKKNVIAGIISRNKLPGELGTGTFRAQVRSPAAPWTPLPSAGRVRPELPSGHMPTGRSLVPTHRMHSGARFRECQFIAGTPSADDECKCLAATGASRVYCPAHEARVWRPAPTSAEATAGRPAGEAT